MFFAGKSNFNSLVRMSKIKMDLPDMFKQMCPSSSYALSGLGGRGSKEKPHYVGQGDCTCLREEFRVGLLAFISYVFLVLMQPC